MVGVSESQGGLVPATTVCRAARFLKWGPIPSIEISLNPSLPSILVYISKRWSASDTLEMPRSQRSTWFLQLGEMTRVSFTFCPRGHLVNS